MLAWKNTISERDDNMTARFTPVAFGIALAATPALAQTNCPWAAGEYRFSESGIYGDFSVNADCTEMVWDRLTEPETTALEAANNGWSGELTKVAVVLLDDGDHVQVTVYGGQTRRVRIKRTN